MTSPKNSARMVAFDVLQIVLRQRQPFDETLDRHPGMASLESRDRAFAHLLVATVLRRLGQLDDAINGCLEKPEELRAKPQDLLRLGAAQILFLGTPPHAAVDTIVSLAALDNATAPYKGLINAVLRRLSREWMPKAEPGNKNSHGVHLQDAVKLNIPPWLWLSWRQTYGVAIAREIAKASLEEACIDISVKSDPAGWAEKLGGQLLPTGSVRLSKKGGKAEDKEEDKENAEPSIRGITALDGFAAGDWWAQDAAAALPVKFLGDVKGKTVVDLCAAPGGKTAQLAAMGASVISVDRSDKRLERLRQNMTRLHLETKVVCKDAASYAPADKAEFVLLDAPCSATGTVRRHPDVLRLKWPEDVARLAELQRSLIDNAVSNVLAPGGTMVYSVCSLQPEEAEMQINSLLERNPSVKRVPITANEVGGCGQFLTLAGDLRCLPSQWPEYGGIDGFFAARLRLAE
ncbi:MAG: RsmB/NOP family class I SAM-dependent RNA methyltransferase [Alphaproteobacteria bacterium]|nr:RsmB/NOP family class I SAM-dependent RNA methyltransferase [Alphaproteobacteria bacterium]